MNNAIYCECVDCGNEFDIPVPDLLDMDQEAVIGELVWCGVCEGHCYECFWGLFSAGCSADSVKDVLEIWTNWAGSYRTDDVQPEKQAKDKNNIN